MSFVSKLKNFFYEEEEVEEEVVEKPKKVEKEKKINIYDIEKEKTRATLKNKKDPEDNKKYLNIFPFLVILCTII